MVTDPTKGQEGRRMPNPTTTIDGVLCEEISGFVDTVTDVEYVVYYRRVHDDYLTVGTDGSKLVAAELDGAFAVRGQEDDDELRDFDPTREGGGSPCERCGAPQEPWRFSTLCQGCLWDRASTTSTE